MRFGVFLPGSGDPGSALPCGVLVVGADLHRAELHHQVGAQAHAARHGVIVVAPDTSPRGEGVADDPAYDLGQGRAFM